MFLVIGIGSWTVAIGLPIYLNKKKHEQFLLRYISASLYIAAIATIFLAAMSDSGFLIVGATLLGPAAASTPIEFARLTGMDTTLWTATILAAIFAFFTAKQAVTPRYLAVGAAGAALLLAVSIILQSSISSRQIQAEFVHMEGECLSARPFISSVMNFDNGGQSFHAILFKGDKIYAWSYVAQTFLPLPEDRPDLKNLAPDKSCDFTSSP